MDNASFHRGGKIRQKCDAAGVKLIYLSPYSPDFNPAEQTFAQLKAFSKKHFHKYVQDPSQGFVSIFNGAWMWWEVTARAREVIFGMAELRTVKTTRNMYSQY